MSKAPSPTQVALANALDAHAEETLQIAKDATEWRPPNELDDLIAGQRDALRSNQSSAKSLQTRLAAANVRSDISDITMDQYSLLDRMSTIQVLKHSAASAMKERLPDAPIDFLTYIPRVMPVVKDMHKYYIRLRNDLEECQSLITEDSISSSKVNARAMLDVQQKLTSWDSWQTVVDRTSDIVNQQIATIDPTSSKPSSQAQRSSKGKGKGKSQVTSATPPKDQWTSLRDRLSKLKVFSEDDQKLEQLRAIIARTMVGQQEHDDAPEALEPSATEYASMTMDTAEHARKRAIARLVAIREAPDADLDPVVRLNSEQADLTERVLDSLAADTAALARDGSGPLSRHNEKIDSALESAVALQSCALDLVHGALRAGTSAKWPRRPNHAFDLSTAVDHLEQVKANGRAFWGPPSAGAPETHVASATAALKVIPSLLARVDLLQDGIDASLAQISQVSQAQSSDDIPDWASIVKGLQQGCRTLHAASPNFRADNVTTYQPAFPPGYSAFGFNVDDVFSSDWQGGQVANAFQAWHVERHADPLDLPVAGNGSRARAALTLCNFAHLAAAMQAITADVMQTLANKMSKNITSLKPESHTQYATLSAWLDTVKVGAADSAQLSRCKAMRDKTDRISEMQGAYYKVRQAELEQLASDISNQQASLKGDALPPDMAAHAESACNLLGARCNGEITSLASSAAYAKCYVAADKEQEQLDKVFHEYRQKTMEQDAAAAELQVALRDTPFSGVTTLADWRERYDALVIQHHSEAHSPQPDSDQDDTESVASSATLSAGSPAPATSEAALAVAPTPVNDNSLSFFGPSENFNWADEVEEEIARQEEKAAKEGVGAGVQPQNTQGLPFSSPSVATGSSATTPSYPSSSAAHGARNLKDNWRRGY